jgi:hypothetical protein
MELYVIDGLNGATDIINSFESSIWNVQFFSKNDFQIKLAGTTENLAILQTGKLLCRAEDIGDGEFNNVMMIEAIQLDYDTEKGWLLTVTGKGLKNILSRRVVWKQTTMTGSVEKAIRQVLMDNVISPEDAARTVPNFILEEEQGFTETADIQLLGENIADWLEATCQTYGFGWDVYIKNNKYVFKLIKGTDRSFNQEDVTPVIFSPEYDNLLSSSYKYNKLDFKNAALIGGEGEGVNKRIAHIGTATGLDRSEMYVDGSGVSSNGEIITVAQYTKMLEDYGQEQLTDTSYVEQFDGEIMADGVYKINEDFFLGDLVQIVNEKGISAVSRIIEIIYSEDETGTAVVPTFSEWEVN